MQNNLSIFSAFFIFIFTLFSWIIHFILKGIIFNNPTINLN